MAFTTAAAERDTMVGLVKALTPNSMAHVPYRKHDNRQEFRSWCSANPQAAFRRFQIRDVGSVPGSEVYDHVQAWHITEFECVVAYPRDYRYGAQALLDLDDVLWEDLNQIDNTIGSVGTGNIACVTTIDKAAEDGTVCAFGVLRLRVEFWRDTSAAA